MKEEGRRKKEEGGGFDMGIQDPNSKRKDLFLVRVLNPLLVIKIECALLESNQPENEL
jgi:hypothetical protein